MREYVTPVNSFILKEKSNEVIFKTSETKIITPVFKNKSIKIAYCDFHPNKEIVDCVVKILLMCGVSAEVTVYNDLKMFSKEYKEYDISLNILYPIIDHKYGIALTILNDLPVQKIEIVKGSISHNNYRIFESVFSYTNHLLPIFQSRNVYLKKNDAVDINQYGGLD